MNTPTAKPPGSGKRQPTSVLVLEIEGQSLRGLALRRVNGSVTVDREFTAALGVDLFATEAELAGRELLNHLEKAGIRERRCLVAIPARWVLTSITSLPAGLPDSDVDSLLQLEAERGFACGIETLQVDRSICTVNSGSNQATLAAVARTQLDRLEAILRAAHLTPVGFTPGIAAFMPPAPGSAEGLLGLVIGPDHLALQVNAGGGIAALRALDAVVVEETGRRTIDGDEIGREVRITLGQLPAELRASVKHVRIHGSEEETVRLIADLRPRLQSAGIIVEGAAGYREAEFGVTLPVGVKPSTVFSLGAAYLAGRKPVFEFLPPRISTWQLLSSRYATRKYRAVGALAGALATLVLVAFLVQQWQLVRLRSRWAGMSTPVRELQELKARTRQYRPWSHDSIRCLTILREVTAAFPEDGSVTARTLEIRQMEHVTCTGTAQDSRAFLATQDRLKANGRIQDLKIEQLRGKNPMQFTFGFRWQEGGSNEN